LSLGGVEGSSEGGVSKDARAWSSADRSKLAAALIWCKGVRSSCDAAAAKLSCALSA
jgi:hypothetical protein